jgi:membrane protease YdiL (CAAX protease family)
MNIKLFLATWLVGLPGVVVTAWLVLPILVANRPLPVPLWVAQWASAAQSAALLALAAALGAALAPRVGLAAPVLSAFIEGKPMLEALRPQLAPGMMGGVMGAAVIWLFTSFAPDALAQVQTHYAMPAVARLLYGGVTEEVLIRWGLMTLLVWLFWRIGQGGAGSPSAMAVYAAIGISAVVFGLGHLPAVSAIVGHISPSVAVYVVAGNAVFGLVAGWLYWRFGLECAMLAHALAHAIVLLIPR